MLKCMKPTREQANRSGRSIKLRMYKISSSQRDKREMLAVEWSEVMSYTDMFQSIEDQT